MKIRAVQSSGPSVLLTGFGPFPGVPVNPTEELVPKLAAAARERFTGARISFAILPTEWRRGMTRSRAAFNRAAADVVIHFGASDQARELVIETRGVNACQFSTDRAGLYPPSEAVDPTGPDMRQATWPAAAILERLVAHGYPARASQDCGTYLCNATLYRTLGMAAGRPGLLAGFVHVPSQLVNGFSAFNLTFEQALHGSLEVVDVCLAAVAAAGEPTGA